jgi:hypothetical protein
MDWDALIEVLLETVKDENARSEIYKKLFDLVGTHDADESLNQDPLFDDVYEAYVSDDEDDSLYEEDEDGFDYDDE